jgi:hypothetical protein
MFKHGFFVLLLRLRFFALSRWLPLTRGTGTELTTGASSGVLPKKATGHPLYTSEINEWKTWSNPGNPVWVKKTISSHEELTKLLRTSGETFQKFTYYFFFHVLHFGLATYLFSCFLWTFRISLTIFHVITRGSWNQSAKFQATPKL